MSAAGETSSPTAGDLVLTEQELRQYTGKRRPSAQVRVLRAMGIDHRVRPDGTVAVLRASLLSGDAARAKVGERFEINWDAPPTKT